MADGSIGLWTVPLAVFGGAIRVSTPFLFVSLGECITERSGRINLGLEGMLVMGAMSGYGISYLTGSPWLGVLAAGITGGLLQRRLGLADASVEVLQGIIFGFVLASDALYGRIGFLKGKT